MPPSLHADQGRAHDSGRDDGEPRTSVRAESPTQATHHNGEQRTSDPAYSPPEPSRDREGVVKTKQPGIIPPGREDTITKLPDFPLAKTESARSPVCDPSGGLGLYVHIPFCETKCGYCDFYSVALKDRNTAPLVAAVIREMEVRLAELSSPIRTIFCGGGTPTLLPIDQLALLLESINRLVPVRRLAEFTVEANPATVEDAKADLLVKSGVTRVSMGAQSFFPNELAALERLHSPEDIPRSVDVLRRAGVEQINLDLIFGIPGQTLDSWAESIRRAVALAPDHIACYGLTYEPGTRLTAQREAGRVEPCDEDLEAEMFQLTVVLLASAGFRQYEISNFARPGRECIHNLIYWRNEPYVGVGPSAAGCYAVSRPVQEEPRTQTPIETSLQTSGPIRESGGGEGNGSVPLRRYKNIPDVGDYVRKIRTQGHAEIESEIIEGETLINEIILMQLRLNEGINIAAFRRRTGLDPRELFGDSLRRLAGQGLVNVSKSAITLTDSGRLMANTIMADLAAHSPTA